MPTKSFSGIYRLVDKEWGARHALRLYFQDVNAECEPFCIPVWFNYSYRPYRGAGPSFKTDVDIGDVLEIEVGESENKKVLLMKASKIDHQPNASLTQGNIVRPTRPTGLIRRNPKLDATVYTNSSEMQMYYMINLMGEDVIHELRVNDEMDEYPYNQLYSLVAKAENNAALLGSRRYLLTVKVLPSFHAESNDPLCMIEYVRSQYINLFPELEAQDFAYIRRTYYGNNRYILCWSIVKGNRIIKLDGIRAATQSIYDDSLITEK